MCVDFVLRLASNAFLSVPYSLEKTRERGGELVALINPYKPRVLFVEHHQTV